MSVGEWLQMEQVILEAKRSGRSVGRELAKGGWILSRQLRNDIEATALESWAEALDALSVRSVKLHGQEALTATDMKVACVAFLREGAKVIRER